MSLIASTSSTRCGPATHPLCPTSGRAAGRARALGLGLALGLALAVPGPRREAGRFPTPHEPSWRFDVGERVACKMGEDTWLPGTVELRDEPDPEAYPGFALLPYVVRIDDGFRMVSAAQDSDAFIVAEQGHAGTLLRNGRVRQRGSLK